MRARVGSIVSAVLALLVGSPARAQPAAREAPDHHTLLVHSETQIELFRRALLPGARGALVETATVAPAYESVLLRARDLDTPWSADALDLELAAWGRVWFGEAGPERSLDADVQTASVRLRHRDVALRLGRQHVAGGAARYARFDGAELAAELGSGFATRVYGGFGVLPRWDERPGYHFLGAASDSELRALAEHPALDRTEHWLAGGRVAWSGAPGTLALSFHEQRREGDLDRRNLAFDGRAWLAQHARLGSLAVLELDSGRVADAALWLDLEPTRAVDLSLEYTHTEPALLLSRHSVLSVFSTDAYDEGGASVRVRATRFVAVEGRGFIQFHDTGHPGARGEIVLRFVPLPSGRLLVRTAYGRVLTASNGYHALRASVTDRFLPSWSSSVEAYWYAYDEPIRGYRSSAVYAGTLGFEGWAPLRTLLGASVARSPYAQLDAQAQLRLACDFDFSSGGPQ